MSVRIASPVRAFTSASVRSPDSSPGPRKDCPDVLFALSYEALKMRGTPHRAAGAEKIDLGEQWTAMTGLPFVYAAWTGRPGAASADDVRALQQAQAEGLGAVDLIAAEYASGDAARTAKAARYLRDNVKYGLGPDEATGLQRFLDYAADLGLAPGRRRLEFF